MGFCTGDCACGTSCASSDDFCQRHDCKRPDCQALRPNPDWPKTLDEAAKALDGVLSKEDRDYILKSERSADDTAVEVHHSLGRHLRNLWGLWGNSPLAQHLREVHGVAHPDDMSHHIIVAYCRQNVRTRFERI